MDDATSKRIHKADARRIRDLERETAMLRQRLCLAEERTAWAESQAAFWRERAMGYVAVETGQRGMWRAALLRLGVGG